MATQYRMSRNTLRNALAVLEAQGLVRRIPRRGTVVSGELAEKRWFSLASTLLFVRMGTIPVQPNPTGYYESIYGGAAQEAEGLGMTIRTEKVAGHVRVPLRDYRPPHPTEIGGVILCGTFDEQYIQMYGSEGVPVVVADYWTRNPHADSVVVDVEGDASMALDHLTQKGHTRIGFCAVGRKEHGADVHEYDPDIPRIVDALRRSARQLHIDMRDEWILLEPWSPAAPTDRVRALLSDSNRPTAMICFSDLPAATTLRVAKEFGLRCPEDISVLTRGDPRLGTRQMTCLQSDPWQMGRMTVKLLVERMQGWRQQAVRVAMVSRLTLGTSTSFAPRVGTQR
jgi:LacI family transcriptional regulator